MKKIFVFIICLFSISFFTDVIAAPSSCPIAPPVGTPGFCSAFKSIASCHCLAHGMPPAACNDMHRIYDIMIRLYHNLATACSPQVQQDTTQQECIDDWNSYNSHC